MRESGLRRDEVLSWANEVIEALVTLRLVCALDSPLDEETARKKLGEIVVQTAVLVERGRMFFKNVDPDSYGPEKEPAYRGFRPRILDHIVVAHKIACEWQTADTEMKHMMALLAKSCLRNFLSLAEEEVGRSRNVSEEAGKGGETSQLGPLLAAIKSRGSAAEE